MKQNKCADEMREREKDDGDDWVARGKINRHFKRILFGCLLAYEVWLG